MVGLRFGRLVVIERSGTLVEGSAHRATWLCLCDCGKTAIVSTKALTTGNTRSCGCLQDDLARTPRLDPIVRQKHDRLRVIWWNMKARCMSPKSSEYHRYGGRGITICEEWLSGPRNFIIWALNNGYEIGLSIDRINNDGNYEPSNCHFIPLGDNARKTSKEKLITVCGRTQNLTQWKREIHCSRSHLGERYRDQGEAATVEFIKRKIGGQNLGIQ